MIDMTDEHRRALAALRKLWPAKADEVERMLAAEPDLERRAAIKINVSIKARLDKFDGEYEPGKRPVETIEIIDSNGATP